MALCVSTAGCTISPEIRGTNKTPSWIVLEVIERGKRLCFYIRSNCLKNVQLGGFPSHLAHIFMSGSQKLLNLWLITPGLSIMRETAESSLFNQKQNLRCPPDQMQSEIPEPNGCCRSLGQQPFYFKWYIIGIYIYHFSITLPNYPNIRYYHV